MSVSSIAVASVKNMHSVNMISSMQDAPSHAHMASSAMTSNIDVKQNENAYKETNPNSMPSDCEQQTSKFSSFTCQDCHKSLCQNLSYGIEQLIPILPQVAPSFALNHGYTDYDATHLIGYWQKILRPPKA